jgi:hypothetical protein
MNYTLHQLRVFQKVVDCRSITKAAESLNMTQPAVSIQLKKLSCSDPAIVVCELLDQRFRLCNRDLLAAKSLCLDHDVA